MKLSNDYTKTSEFIEAENEKCKKDVSEIQALIKEQFSNCSVTVWHCCTPQGKGYYTVKDAEKTRFARSVRGIEPVGAVWSSRAWLRIFEAQKSLNKYLRQVRQLLEEQANVTMEIRQLYLPWVLDTKGFERTVNSEMFLEEGEIAIKIKAAYDTLQEYKNEYADDIAEYESSNGVFSYYNKEGGIYYAAQDHIDSAVSKIYKDRKSLEDAGLWESVRKMIDELNDMVLMRARYEDWPSL